MPSCLAGTTPPPAMASPVQENEWYENPSRSLRRGRRVVASATGASVFGAAGSAAQSPRSDGRASAAAPTPSIDLLLTPATPTSSSFRECAHGRRC